jgi:hypothetical protein
MKKQPSPSLIAPWCCSAFETVPAYAGTLEAAARSPAPYQTPSKVSSTSLLGTTHCDGDGR